MIEQVSPQIEGSARFKYLMTHIIPNKQHDERESCWSDFFGLKINRAMPLQKPQLLRKKLSLIMPSLPKSTL